MDKMELKREIRSRGFMREKAIPQEYFSYEFALDEPRLISENTPRTSYIYINEILSKRKLSDTPGKIKIDVARYLDLLCSEFLPEEPKEYVCPRCGSTHSLDCSLVFVRCETCGGLAKNIWRNQLVC